MSKTKIGYEVHAKPVKGSPAVGINPTTEEIIAAIEGRLKPRDLRGDRKQEALTRMRADGAPGGRPLGVTTGLPINMAFCYMLQQNERAPKRKKLTDLQLTEWLRAEFPKRPTARFEDIQTIRNWYLQGRLTRGHKPHQESHRYDSGGAVIDAKYSYKTS